MPSSPWRSTSSTSSSPVAPRTSSTPSRRYADDRRALVRLSLEASERLLEIARTAPLAAGRKSGPVREDTVRREELQARVVRRDDERHDPRPGSAGLGAELDRALVAVVAVGDQKLGAGEDRGRVRRQPPQAGPVDLEIRSVVRRVERERCRRRGGRSARAARAPRAAAAAAPREFADGCARAEARRPSRTARPRARRRRRGAPARCRPGRRTPRRRARRRARRPDEHPAREPVAVQAAGFLRGLGQRHVDDVVGARACKLARAPRPRPRRRAARRGRRASRPRRSSGRRETAARRPSAASVPTRFAP